MWVTIGVINQVDKTWHTLPIFTHPMSNLEKPYQNYDREYTYGTLEQDFFRIDGKMLFCQEMARILIRVS